MVEYPLDQRLCMLIIAVRRLAENGTDSANAHWLLIEHRRKVVPAWRWQARRHPRLAQIVAGVGAPHAVLIWAVSNSPDAWRLRPCGRDRIAFSRTRSRIAPFGWDDNRHRRFLDVWLRALNARRRGSTQKTEDVYRRYAIVDEAMIREVASR